MSVLLRDDLQLPEQLDVVRRQLGPLVPVNDLVEHLSGALEFLAEDAIAVHLAPGCDRWTSVAVDRVVPESATAALRSALSR